ncbi:BrnT family toxin [Pseudomonas lactis]|uniref:BrnT family toxin n=1 Tax=Pseudomonas lactis TaxID=1615674 RepID=UPI0039B06BCF
MIDSTTVSVVIAMGYIGDRLHVVVFTPRGDAVHVISFRKANKREVKNYDQETQS